MKNFFRFCRECVGELKKVTWPTRSEVFASVKVVLISTVIFAIILGVLDWGFTSGLQAIFG